MKTESILFHGIRLSNSLRHIWKIRSHELGISAYRYPSRCIPVNEYIDDNEPQYDGLCIIVIGTTEFERVYLCDKKMTSSLHDAPVAIDEDMRSHVNVEGFKHFCSRFDLPFKQPRWFLGVSQY